MIEHAEYKIDICGECGERVLGAAYSCSNLHLGPNRVIDVVPKLHRLNGFDASVAVMRALAECRSHAPSHLAAELLTALGRFGFYIGVADRAKDDLS